MKKATRPILELRNKGRTQYGKRLKRGSVDMEVEWRRMELQMVFLAMAWALLLASATGVRESVFKNPGIGSVTYKITEASSPAPPRTQRGFAGASLEGKVLLIVTDVSMCPFVIFKSIGSWSTTRNIFPAKSVLCNFGGAFMWAIYMNFQMYLSYGYYGLDALWVNCLSMAFNVAVLLAYLKDGKEYLKFTMSLVGSVGLAVVFVVILVFHPYSEKHSQHASQLLNWWSTFTAISGIVIFAILNLIPYKDLWNMSGNGDRDVTLDWPMQLCTIFHYFVSFLWTIYAWVFPSSAPNYFLIANLIAAILSLVQCSWLGFICLHHRKVEGQITDAESLRTSFLKLAETLDDMASVPETHAFWKRTGFFRDFLDHVLVGTQSLSKIRLDLEKQLPILQEKEATAAARQAQIQVAATTLASNAKSMVEDAAGVANEGTAAAAAAQLATQEAAALKARQEATAAIASFRQAHGPPLAQQNRHEAADHHDAEGDGEDNSVPVAPQADPHPPTVSDILELSRTIQDGVGAALGASSSHAVAAADAAAAQTDARAARSSCSDLISACDLCIGALEAASTAIGSKLADAQGDARALRAGEAGTLQEARVRALRAAIRGCPPRLRFVAGRVRSCLQVINATAGIPAPVREGLREAHEHMLVLKIAADHPLFRRRLGRRLRRLFCRG